MKGAHAVRRSRPGRARYTPIARRAVRLGYDTDLLAAVCEKLARALMQDLRREAKRQHGLASVTPLHAGVMVAVQRFRSDLGLYVHLHCLATNGVFEDLGEAVRFLLADHRRRHA